MVFHMTPAHLRAGTKVHLSACSPVVVEIVDFDPELGATWRNPDGTLGGQAFSSVITAEGWAAGLQTAEEVMTWDS